MDKRKLKVLLIGGTGVLSTDIRELAVKKGYEVYILNRGQNKSINIDKSIKVINADIRDIESTKEKVKDYKFDVVVDFLSFNVSQLKGTLYIFENNCKQYIFISSATVYAKTKKGDKIDEAYKIENHEWDYAQNKIACEEYLKDNYRNTKQEYTIIRPYVTYSDTRIPFAVIPHNKQWTLANRIINNKPVVLWDDGQATCTLTSSKDFAVGVVGLFNNEKAINNTYHITTDYVLTWKQALKYIAKALGGDAIIANLDSHEIFNKMPEYKGILLCDKGLDREFNNNKIKDAVPEFNAQIKFEEGIKSTIQFYRNNKFMQDIDYEWDARIDNMIKYYYKKKKIKHDNLNLNYAGKEKISKNKIQYYICRNNFTYYIYLLIRKIYRILCKLV